MTTSTTIRINTPRTANQEPFKALSTAASQGDKSKVLGILARLADLLNGEGVYESSPGTTTVEVQVGSDATIHANQTLTFSSAPTAGKTYTVNGTAFTAVANSATPTNNQFKIGLSAAGAAANLAKAINDSTTAGVSKQVYATALGKAASGTAAFASTIATDSLTLLGTVLTVVADAAAKLAAPDTEGTGAVVVGATNTAMGDNMAAEINTHFVLKKLFKASNNAGTVTVTALNRGTAGNVRFLETSNTITCSGSGVLTGGVDDVGTGTGELGAAGVVTVYARAPGATGNKITVATNDATTMALGSSTLLLGAGDNALVYVLKYF